MKNILKILRVNKTFIIMFFIKIMIVSCKPSHIQIYKRANSSIHSTYIIEKFKSKSELFTGVHFNTYDSLGNLDALIQINNVNLRGKTFSLGEGKHNIKVAFIGMKTAEIKNLKVKLNDSIVINTHLKHVNIVD